MMILFSFSAQSKDAQQKSFKPYKAYLSTLEDGDAITIFNKPGITWKNCTYLTDQKSKKKYCEEAQGWPDRSSEIIVTGPEYKTKVIDPFSGEEIEETYVPVHFSYSTISAISGPSFKEGSGVIAKSMLTKAKYDSFFSNTLTTVPKKENCPQPGSSLMKVPAHLPELTKEIKKLDVTAAADAVYKSVGQCAVSPPTKTPKNLPEGNIYDQLVLNKLKNNPVPNILTESKKPMTQADLINIDALARTLYGEMGKCFSKGLQYPIAAARVAINRVDAAPRMSEWVDPPQANGKPALAQIITTPKKFNNWMAHNGRRPNGPLHQSLCPPKAIDQPFWKENQASKDEVDIWQKAVLIATEAVLYPTKFKARSPAMNDIYFYTSGMGHYGKNKLVHPVINGRPLDDDSCVEAWKEPAKK